ncbi:type II secretion system F family protein [Halomonas sp. SpR8]|uniref:type II secretion system F family protein n=1 Tax=Halomonas sp. SpR8 TaxID=3050463 RepID=UPI0027E51ED2|nr:type II secretion system F family protein [Halomonas sp. SpR8]MDQ7728162.1 type II secretion system F family protein [Halomonas sp. SpR8]
MSHLSILLLGVSAVLLLASALMMLASKRQAVGERIYQRLSSDGGFLEPKQKKKSGFSLWLMQAGIQLPGWLTALLVALVLLIALLFIRVSWFMPVLIVGGVALVVYLIGQWRAHKRVERMISQMPGFLDHMVRSIKSGRTMGDAMLLAMKRCSDPLHQAMAPVRRDIELGVPMVEAFNEFASLYKREEFHILALGVRINQRYGGNSADMLKSLIMMIRDRERASRQLSAMTGETRISAIVLAGLPLALGGYILLSNPDFLIGMWVTSAGKIMLLLSLALQLMGCFILWRMLKSI